MKAILCFTILALVISLIWPVTVVAQRDFKYDKEQNKYWNGASWNDLGDEGYESAISFYEPALSKYNSGKTMKTVALVLGIPAGFAIGWGLGTDMGKREGEKTNTTVFYIVGAALFVPALTLEILGNNSITKSAEIYEQHIKGKSETSFFHNIRIAPALDLQKKAFSIQLMIRML